MIKLVVSVVDGVLTDGKVPIDELGNVQNKLYCLSDFEAINYLKKKGVIVVFLSSDNYINYHLFRRKNIPFYFCKNKDKYSTTVDILRRYGVLDDECLFIGSSLSDVKCMQMIKAAYCTNEMIGFNKFYTEKGSGIFTEVFKIIEGINDYS
jgi:3-deoxy-D-manno-octulosonate 8-phosphate phosphatase KdsC-like HAD superfamily phosphatase